MFAGSEVHFRLSQGWQWLLNVKSALSPSFGDEALKDPKISFSSQRVSLVAVSFVSNLLTLALPIMMLQVYDRILSNNSYGTLRVLVAGVCIAIILESLLRLTRAYVVNWSGAVYEHTLMCNGMRHMLEAELSSFENQSISEQLQRVNSINKLREFTSGQALITLIDLPFVAIYLLLIAYLAGSLVLVPIILLFIFGFVAWQLGIKLKKNLVGQEKADEHRRGFIIETLNGIHTVKSLGLESIFQRRYEGLQKESSLASYQVAKQSNIASNFGALFTQGMIICIITFGAPMVLNGQLTMGTLIACVLLSGRIMSPVQKALGIWTRFQDFQLAKKDVSAIFQLPKLDKSDPSLLGERDGCLQINNLSFSYGEYEPQLFKEVSIDFMRGDSIAISGDHSCGKTTLLKLIAGLYKPSSGNILINGLDSTLYPSDKLVEHVGYLEMEGVIFKGTILQNLNAFGSIPMSSVRELMQLLDLERDITKLPAGFDTKLEGGFADPIPPGLKQRITIVRVLASKPRILLFDNADRSLDKHGYNQVYQLLARLKNKVTMVLVSDDRNIIRLAKHEYIVEDGRLIKSELSDRSKMHDVQHFQELRL